MRTVSEGCWRHSKRAAKYSVTWSFSIKVWKKCIIQKCVQTFANTYVIRTPRVCTMGWSLTLQYILSNIPLCCYFLRMQRLQYCSAMCRTGKKTASVLCFLYCSTARIFHNDPSRISVSHLNTNTLFKQICVPADTEYSLKVGFQWICSEVEGSVTLMVQLCG